MHPQQIASELAHSSYINERYVGTDKMGWEETKGNVVSQGVARTQVTRVIEKRTRNIVETATYDKLLRLANSATNVDLLTHSQIELGELLGEGGFNRVYKVNSMPDNKSVRGNEYVVKVLRKELINNEAEFALCAADIVKEAILMAAFDHPHILRTRAMAAGGIAGFGATGRGDAFFMVMGHLKESLDDRITEWKSKSKRNNLRIRHRHQKRDALLRTRLHVAIDLADALEYLHSFNILHRDLKPSNIGFDSTGSLKVFDFDLARLIPESRTPDETFALTSKAGSLRYMSPECGKGEPYNLKSDVYSFSLLLYEIMSLKEPYVKLNAEKQELRVFREGLRPKISSSWPVEVQNLLHRGWSQESSERPSMNEVLALLERQMLILEAKSHS
jgi:serine/threonine protein kinase